MMCRPTPFIILSLCETALVLYSWALRLGCREKDFREVVSYLYNAFYKFLDAESLPLQFRLDFSGMKKIAIEIQFAGSVF